MSLVINWYGFDHNAVQKKFEGDLTFKNTIEMSGYNPVAVYHNANPNLEKGHKPYLTLSMVLDTLYVGGMTEEELNKYRYVTGIECLECKDQLVSRNRHDAVTCRCGKCMVDGGRSYLRYEGPVRFIYVDLLRGVETSEVEYLEHREKESL